MSDQVSLRHAQSMTRRHFLRDCQLGLGGMALAGMSSNTTSAALANRVKPLMSGKPHFKPRAKSVILLHFAGSPPHLDLYDYKPELAKRNMEPCPDELLAGKKFAFIKGKPKLLGPNYKFQQHGESGAWIGETLPHLATCADDLCIVKSMYTDQFNHAPAQLLLHTGNQQFGGASFGSWVTYGLGTENQNLPGFVVLPEVSYPQGGAPNWSNGYLPAHFQGTPLRPTGSPLLNLKPPPAQRPCAWLWPS